MGFLKKLGVILLKATEIVTGIAPILSSVPGASGPVQIVSRDLAAIAQIVTTAEAMGQALNLAGPDKLKAAAPMVAQIVLQSSLLAERKIEDPVKFQAACATIASGMADLLNSLKDDIDTTSKT